MKDPSSPVCRTISTLLSRIGDKWTVYVVRLLSDGSMRFNEIKRAIPAISQRMLTLTLRGLERDGLVTRTIYPTLPPRVDYELTDLGRTLITTLMAMGEWAVSNRAKVEKARAAFDAKEKKTKAKIGLARVMPLPWGRQN